MIAANELRIGNWLKVHVAGNFKVKEVGVVSVVFERLENKGFYSYDILHGITLTPEILEKAGFKKYGIRYEKDELTNDILQGNGFYMAGITPEIKYAHQLQNIFYALTGKELEINLDK